MTDTLSREIFVPLKIDTKKGRKACVIKPNDSFPNTPLAKLLAKAYLMEQKLLEDPNLGFNEFCRLHNVSPRYLRGILSLNCLSPKIKKLIMRGWMSKHLSVQEIVTGKMPEMWEEQEELFFTENITKKHSTSLDNSG
ncbi:MAG: hypothetical protein LBU27_04615 [Candidatus Peribacteria bacterium]|jgi:hypothetical protein|nr:hypothetical protein [Candidatus Peribacteria bacterium]